MTDWLAPCGTKQICAQLEHSYTLFAKSGPHFIILWMTEISFMWICTSLSWELIDKEFYIMSRFAKSLSIWHWFNRVYCLSYFQHCIHYQIWEFLLPGTKYNLQLCFIKVLGYSGWTCNHFHIVCLIQASLNSWEPQDIVWGRLSHGSTIKSNSTHTAALCVTITEVSLPLKKKENACWYRSVHVSWTSHKECIRDYKAEPGTERGGSQQPAVHNKSLSPFSCLTHPLKDPQTLADQRLNP